MKYDILPPHIVEQIRNESKGYDFGMVRVDIHLRDGKPRWEISRTRSIIEDDQEKVKHDR
jgi:hypothetical protein